MKRLFYDINAVFKIEKVSLTQQSCFQISHKHSKRNKTEVTDRHYIVAGLFFSLDILLRAYPHKLLSLFV